MKELKDRIDTILKDQQPRLLQMFQNAELADTHVERLKPWLDSLISAGVLLGQAFLGSEILTLPPEVTAGTQDSGVCFQAVICLPGGLGVIECNSDTWYQLMQEPEALESSSWIYFKAYDQCSVQVRDWLLPQIEDLIDKLMTMLCCKKPTIDPGWEMVPRSESDATSPQVHHE
ncbi:MAG: hypothetical protein JNJ77_12765 [Planctomycetia bacterium]|nr:hypothetical protein [Planctomycetia bacterium]